MTVLPKEIMQLTKLTSLDLNRGLILRLGIKKFRGAADEGNKLMELPKEIAQLAVLETLNLNNNHLTALPKEIEQLTRLRHLDLRRNPLPVPPEVLELTDRPGEILKLLFRLETEDRRPLHEAKLIIVGEGTVGKTSLVRRLIDGDYNPRENKTEGIQIREWPVMVGADRMKLNVWDFGGQEIMHATHQFFMTKRSLYVLVLNARSDEHGNRIEYWLKLIESLGGASPVIVAINKSEQHPLQLDRRGLQEKYPNIREFFDISCERATGIEQLRERLTAEIDRLPHVRDPLPLSWFKIKERLEADTHDYLTLDQYDAICDQEGEREAGGRALLLGYLHDLGVVLNFREDDRLALSETNVLKPEWVTGGVYQLLNRFELSQSKGRLRFADLGRYLDPARYGSKKHYHFIIEMMEKFELCFPLDAARSDYLIPSLLAKEEPDLNWNQDDCLAFQYHYDVLPGSIISRFITRNHQMVSQQTYWRTGVVLRSGGNRALVKADLEDGRIFIWVNGTPATQRDLLSAIRLDFEKIHRSIERLKVAQRVPIPHHPELDPVDYELLLQCEEQGDDAIRVKGLREKVSVQMLLDGLESRAQRQQRQERIDERREREMTKATRTRKPAPQPPAKNNPWMAGSFYIFAFLVVLAAIVTALIVINKYGVSWQAAAILPVIIIAGFLGVGIIGANQLKNDKQLKDESYVQLMIESYKRLPLLRGRDGGNVLKDE